MALAWKPDAPEAPAVHPPRGLVRLYLILSRKFGEECVNFAPALTRAVGGKDTLEIHVKPDDFESALEFSSATCLEFEDEYDEVYSVIVIPDKN